MGRAQHAGSCWRSTAWTSTKGRTGHLLAWKYDKKNFNTSSFTSVRPEGNGGLTIKTAQNWFSDTKAERKQLIWPEQQICGKSPPSGCCPPHSGFLTSCLHLEPSQTVQEHLGLRLVSAVQALLYYIVFCKIMLIKKMCSSNTRSWQDAFNVNPLITSSETLIYIFLPTRALCAT